MNKYEFNYPIHNISRKSLLKIEKILSEYKSIEDVEKEIDLQEFSNQNLKILVDLSQNIVWHLENKFRFIVIKQLPFSIYGDRICQFLLLALSSLIGNPSYPGFLEKSKIWNVEVKNFKNKNYLPTISEHSHRAELHTDSSYKDIPDRYVLMYSVRSARDRGGSSLIADSKLIYSNCDKDLLHFLKKEKFPFKIPMAFRKKVNNKKDNICFFPLISDYSSLRYRYDIIKSGMINCEIPISQFKQKEEALDLINNIILSLPVYKFFLEPRDLLIFNNHELLHGRTSFKDVKRLIYRIRIKSFE